MIFVLLFGLLLGGILVFSQFGAMPNVATPKAEVLAGNMATWHQAAMLEVQSLSFNTSAKPCPAAPKACPVNNYLLDNAYKPDAAHQLKINWPEYTPMTVQGTQTGWQSFYLGNVDGFNPTGTGTQNYVLTVFRGFGGGNATTASGIGMEAGKMDASNFTNGLFKIMGDRSGIGILSCDTATTICTIRRSSSAVDAAGNADRPLAFKASALADVKDQNSNNYFSSPAAQLDGKLAVMTHVNGVEAAKLFLLPEDPSGINDSAANCWQQIGTGSIASLLNKGTSHVVNPSTGSGMTIVAQPAGGCRSTNPGFYTQTQESGALPGGSSQLMFWIFGSMNAADSNLIIKLGQKSGILCDTSGVNSIADASLKLDSTPKWKSVSIGGSVSVSQINNLCFSIGTTNFGPTNGPINIYGVFLEVLP